MEARSDSVGEAKIRGGIRRWNRENGCALVGGEEGKAAEGDHHREGIHSLTIEDYIVYIHTFSMAPEPNVSSRPNVPHDPKRKESFERTRCKRGGTATLTVE
jgi:hypothetical protein